MTRKLFAWVSWITFLVSAVGEWGFDLDLPLGPAGWLIVAVVVGGMSLPKLAYGLENSWTNTANANWKWEDASKWSLGVAPALSQSKTFITNGVAVVPRTKNVIIDATTAASFSSTMAISNLTVSSPSPIAHNNLILTNTGAASLHVLNNLVILPGGGLIVSNSSLINNSLFNIQSGAQFINANVIVSGAGASLRVDGDGTATFTGGQLDTSAANMTIGSGAGSSQMTISNCTWHGGGNFVGGEGGSGTLILIDSICTLDNEVQGLLIGPGSPGSGAVWLNGGVLTITNSIGTNFFSVVIGDFSPGQMTVSNGTWRTTGIEVGGDYELNEGDTGTLTIAGGTNIVGFSGIHIGNTHSSEGYVWVTGGQLLETNSTLEVGYQGLGRLVQSNGTMQTFGENIGAWNGGTSIYGGTHLVGNGGMRIASTSNGGGALLLVGGQLVATNSYTEIGYLGYGELDQYGGTGTLYGVDVGLDSPSGVLNLFGGKLTIGTGGLTLGTLSGATGAVEIAFGQLVVTNSTVTIGSQGMGTMTIDAGTWQSLHVIVGDGAGSQGLLDVEGGVSSVYADLLVGGTPCTATGLVTMNGGELRVTNQTGTAVMEIRSGTLTQAGGILGIDRLVITNACGHFIHTGGTLSITATNLAPNLDADGDGLPNGWEQMFGLNLFDPTGNNGANGDPDGDGFTNLQEYLAHTDPTNKASFFAITAIAREGNNIRVTWHTGAGNTNALQRTAGTPGGSYSTNSFAAIFTATNIVGTVTNYLDVGAATNSPARYYRVRLVP